MTSTRHLSLSEADTFSHAANFAGGLKAGDVILLSGELGAGKTAFTKGVVGHFDNLIAVTSPTFSLINSYPTIPPVHHFDLYRLNDENDLVDLGLFEYVSSGGILIVEWAEKWRRNLPEKFYQVSIGIVDEHRREILIELVSNDNSRN